jgi:two-component system, NtrC family, nitrogen regulation sensor histidine kinase NtrY
VAIRRERTLERRLFRWMLVLTMVPALVLLAAGGWVVATSLGMAAALGPWEAVAESGRRVVELADPIADPALADALAAHRAELSMSLTQARRWAFLGERLREILPWLVLVLAAALFGLAAMASRRLARELARPIQELVVLAGRLGHGEPLPRPSGRAVREVRVLDQALRDAGAELAAAQQRAVTAERLRVWGEMARRVAHEMKNPLTPLRLAAHRVGRAAPRSGPDGVAMVEAAEVIDQEVRRLEELAAQFAALGRPPEGPAVEMDIGDLVRTVLETDVGPDVVVTLDAPPGLSTVMGHYDSLLRAFRNLVRNAVEAMEDVPAPRLEVEVRQVSGTAGASNAAGWVETRITDHGIGLPPDAADRIFEPDFTTKRRGTGLGLALVRQAVEAAGGTVHARNRESGAEFTVRLPLTGPAITTHSTGEQNETPAR